MNKTELIDSVIKTGQVMKWPIGEQLNDSILNSFSKLNHKILNLKQF